MTQGDLASWILAGSYTRAMSCICHRSMPTKRVVHGMQRYLGGNGDALAAMRRQPESLAPWKRIDSWQIARPVRVTWATRATTT